MGENYNDITEAAFRHIKGQRHDFMNYLQVIYGYIQMGRREAAMGYIMKVNSRMLLEGRLGGLDDKGLYLAISEFAATCYRHNVETELCCMESYISYGINTENISKELEAFTCAGDTIGDHLEESEAASPKVYMYLHEENNKRAFIAATEEIALEGIYERPWKVYEGSDLIDVCLTDGAMLLKIQLS